jgi:hypothetical protein
VLTGLLENSSEGLVDIVVRVGLFTVELLFPRRTALASSSFYPLFGWTSDLLLMKKPMGSRGEIW